MLKFPDGTRVAVSGLEKIMAGLAARNRPADDRVADEIIAKLEAGGNFIPSSSKAHREYAFVLRHAYLDYLKNGNNDIMP